MKKHNNKKIVSFEEQYGMGGPVLDYIKSPTTALQENQFAWAKSKAEGALNPMSQALDWAGPLLSVIGEVAKGQGVFDKDQAAMGASYRGNQKKISVEGGEIMETPKGDILKMKGPKHENGGIPLEISDEDLNSGSYNVYSNRVKGHTGKTLSKEKEGREKKIRRYEKYIKDNPGDLIAKNTLERLKMSSKLADTNALNLQQQIREAYEAGNAETQIPEDGAPVQAAVGLSTQPGPKRIISDKLLESLKAISDESALGVIPYNPKEDNSEYEKNSTNPTPGKTSSAGSNFTIGDGLGTIGMIYQGIAAKNAANNNMSRLDLEENIYNRYGHDAVLAEQNKQIINNLERDNSTQDVTLSSNALMDRLASSGRGINEVTAGMVSAQQAENKAIQDINANHTKNEINNQDSMTKLLQGIQDKYLSEEKAVQERNEQRLDTAQSAVDAAEVNMGDLLSRIGRVANEGLLREVMAKNVSQQSTHFNSDSKGKVGGNPSNPGQTFDSNVQKDFDEALVSNNMGGKETAKGEVTQETPATTTPDNRITGSRLYSGYSLTKDQTRINNLLTAGNLNLDLTSPQKVEEFQKLIGAPVDGKFGSDSYEALIKYISGMTNKEYDSATGLTYNTKK